MFESRLQGILKFKGLLGGWAVGVSCSSEF
jgi:hypothetical protein